VSFCCVDIRCGEAVETGSSVAQASLCCKWMIIYRRVPRSVNLLVLFLLSSQKSKFCPLAEKRWIGSKNGWHLLGSVRRALPPCKVWGARTIHAGCKCENAVFICLFLSRSEAGALFVRGGILWAGFVLLFMGRFWSSFQRFFQKDLSDGLDSSHFCC